MSTLLEMAEILQKKGVFLGGPIHLFEVAGTKLMNLLLSLGLNHQSKVLDIGCGCLRNGYHLIKYLDPLGYCGIEPNREMLEAGLSVLLSEAEQEEKKPRFSFNDKFDLGCFECKFDFFVARSIWTHASKGQIITMLDGFVDNATDHGVFVTSFKPPAWWRWDYKDDKWVGRSHESNRPGIVCHSYKWITHECRLRNLDVCKNKAHDFGGQQWLVITRS